MSTEYEVLDLVFSHVYQVKTKKLYNLNNLTINSNKTIAKNAFWTSCISHMLLHTTPPTKERIQIQTSSWSRRHLLSKNAVSSNRFVSPLGVSSGPSSCKSRGKAELSAFHARTDVKGTRPQRGKACPWGTGTEKQKGQVEEDHNLAARPY